MAQSVGGRYRGVAVIIVNRFFTSPGKGIVDHRVGASYDRKMMEELFVDLDFEVKMFENLTSAQIHDTLDRAAKEWSHDYEPECFVCVISSHGEEIEQDKKKYSTGGTFHTVFEPIVLGSDSISVRVNDVLGRFAENNCDTYKGKPKLFFIQACRTRLEALEKKYDIGVDINIILKNLTSQKQPADGSGDGIKDDDKAIVHPEFPETIKGSTVVNTDAQGSGDTHGDDLEQKDQTDSNPVPTSDERMERGPMEMTSVECPKNCLVVFPVTSVWQKLKNRIYIIP